MKFLSLIGVCFIFIIGLSACAGNGIENETHGKSLGTGTVNHKKNNNKSVNNINNFSENNQEHKSSKNVELNNNPGNQLNLKIGDTGIVKSNINKYKITLESVKITNSSIGGEIPQSDQFILAEITLKNIGEKSMNAEDVADELNLGGGSNNIASLISGVDALKGEIQPGKTLKGVALFDIYKAEKYKLIDGLGLADQGAGVQNKITWTFKASQVK